MSYYLNDSLGYSTKNEDVCIDFLFIAGSLFNETKMHWRRKPPSGLYKLLVKWVTISTLIGIITGALVSLLELSVLDVSEFALRRVAESGYFWLVPIVPLIGLMITGILRDKCTKIPSLHGTEEVLDAYHYRDGDLVLRDSIPKTIGSVLTIGSGGSAGLEGPSIHIGGAVGVGIRRLLKRLGIEEDGRVLLLTGAASGIGAIFKAPLTGLMFSLEVPYKDDMAHQAVIPALISSVVSYLTLVSIVGPEPIFKHFKPFGEVNLYILSIGLVEGLVIGAASVLFVKLVHIVERILESKSFTVRGIIGGISLGALAIPTFFSTGTLYPFGLSYDLVRLSFKGGNSAFFLGMAILKMIATAITLGTAGIGGVFIPSIVIGSSLGSSFSIINPKDTSLFVAIGMSAFLSAAFKTPLTAVTFAAETTGSEAYIIPGLVASAVAYIISGKHSLPKNQKIVETTKIEELEGTKVKELMTLPPPALICDTTVKEFFNKVFLKHREYFIFPVKSRKGKFVGVVALRDINKLPPSKWDKVKLIDIVREVEFLKPDDNLMTALDKMYEFRVLCMPVMDPKTRKVIGMISADSIAMLLEQKRKLKRAALFFR